MKKCIVVISFKFQEILYEFQLWSEHWLAEVFLLNRLSPLASFSSFLLFCIFLREQFDANLGNDNQSRMYFAYFYLSAILWWSMVDEVKEYHILSDIHIALQWLSPQDTQDYNTILKNPRIWQKIHSFSFWTKTIARTSLYDFWEKPK